MHWTELTGGGMGLNLPTLRSTFGTEAQSSIT